jgi:hypothetical protein
MQKVKFDPWPQQPFSASDSTQPRLRLGLCSRILGRKSATLRPWIENNYFIDIYIQMFGVESISSLHSKVTNFPFLFSFRRTDVHFITNADARPDTNHRLQHYVD